MRGDGGSAPALLINKNDGNLSYLSLHESAVVAGAVTGRRC